MTSPQFAVLVPVKPPAQGKSRLVAPSQELRRGLAAAFALDTVAACLAAGRVAAVLAVTDDAAFSQRLAEAGCAAIPDGVSGDLNATLRQAAAEAGRRWPELEPVAVCADLPALRPGDLDEALAAVPAARPCFVSDAAGVGTTMYAAPLDHFDPRFGVGSRLAHLGTGAVELGGDLRTLRHDVDDLEDLRQVLALGLGDHTVAAAGPVLAQ
ncbi:2-phospho-L-lactate guanylyltransferase [Nocardioides panaciterrulae]|uniref:2-phospho-L-lactate guanylyltransferase n=1 Tax=Nocardioides panaciterrulae TaxID=661492 RepID=A0A7Y9JB10_9ACTN|nr:2-phospho-L-lactate guanylyltransferase [Nocardioides panaciterrulae]NYD42460.1 2-phospho-L-lactate guanylyltransferase [Nocardioides panaciterrulae]